MGRAESSYAPGVTWEDMNRGTHSRIWTSNAPTPNQPTLVQPLGDKPQPLLTGLMPSPCMATDLPWKATEDS